MILRQPQKTIKMETFGLWRREDHLFDYGQCHRGHRAKKGPVRPFIVVRPTFIVEKNNFDRKLTFKRTSEDHPVRRNYTRCIVTL